MVEVLSRSSPSSDIGECLVVRVRLDHPTDVVVLAGELDLAHLDAAVHACALPEHVHVIVDLANVTFMDCSGYGALVHARTILERRGGSLSFTGPVGEPLWLLSLIDPGAALEHGDTDEVTPGSALWAEHERAQHTPGPASCVTK